MEESNGLTGLEIAVIGMACRVPGAKDVREFWDNVRNGVESIDFLDDEELLEMGESEQYFRGPGYVRATRRVEDVDLFDAAFFGINPREAELMDPQQRLFLELTWEALENAGYDPETYEGLVGVYAGCKMSTYMLNVFSHPEIFATIGDLPIQAGNDKDYVATRLAYKLGFGGPAVSVQTACSTSLVATHLACQTLLSGECDMALAGAVNLRVPQSGYTYREGEIYSPDGHIRTFSADASGTIFGNGLGMVVLKRLEDALEDGDRVRAVIKGTAVNNDSSHRAGFTAPGADGQRRVIRAAQTVSEVDPDTITYVETHGTGTPTGDPIEVSALSAAFRESTERNGYCALGAVKTNVGHLGAAAGVTGLIKTVLALEHREIPPNLNFTEPNPQIDFASTPFYLATELHPWETDGSPRRAAVSAFGIGGTNAHAILEEAPEAPAPAPSRRWQLVVLSARTESALETATANLAAHLETLPGASFPDAAYTLQVGRRAFEHRRALVASGPADAAAVLAGGEPKRLRTALADGRRRRVAFLFSGQGSQYAGMGRGLYESEALYRETVDECCEKLRSHLDLDLRELLHPADGAEEEAGEKLRETRYTQPALFVVEYALARLWRSWGVDCEAMLGHSIGEYVAACLAEVFSLDDALALVAARGRLMQGLPGGSMLSVPLDEEDLAERLDPQISLAALNAPGRSVVAGPDEAIEAFAERLAEDGVKASRLHTSHAFHSEMMEPILAPFVERVRKVELRAPKIPFVSNVSGQWIRDEEATDPEYWALHLRRAVRFADGVARLFEDEGRVLLEVGPGKTLATLARRHPSRTPAHPVLSSLRHPKDAGVEDQAFALDTLGQLWLAGVAVDWRGFYEAETRRRAELPTYPFERRRFWIDMSEEGMMGSGALKKKELGDWFYLPYWRPSVAPGPTAAGEDESWLVFADDSGLSDELVSRLRAEGRGVSVVRRGEKLEEAGEGEFRLSPTAQDDYGRLFQAVGHNGDGPSVVVHAWSLSPVPDSPITVEESEALLADGFRSLLHLVQALGSRPARLLAVSNGLAAVPGETRLVPEKAALLGPILVSRQEAAELRASSVDTDLPEPGTAEAARWVDHVLAEARTADPPAAVAYRGGERWVRGYGGVHLPEPGRTRLRPDGVYLVTGGLGGLGLTFAELFARECRPKLALLGYSALPPRDEWDAWLQSHPDDDRSSRRIRRVREIEELGSEVLVLSADVGDREQMARAVGEVRERFGAVHGLLHSAGVPGGGLIQLKTPEAAARVLAPKVRAMRVLDEVLRGEPLEFRILCSSTIAVFGTFGQVDYCAANNFLDAYAHASRLAGEPWTLSVNWGAWEEVGMAVESGLVAAAPKAPAGVPRPAVETSAPLPPLLDRCVESSPTAVVYETDFDPERHWVLNEHRINGRPALPGTTYLEIARSAFAHAGNGRANGGVELSDVIFFTPLMVGDGENGLARITLDREEERFAFRVDSAAAGGAWQPHVRGTVGPLDSGPPAVHELEALKARCAKEEKVIGDLVKSEKSLVEWGPRWQNLKRVHLGDGECVAELELGHEFAGEDREFLLHPAVLDVATSMVSALENDAFLPLSYGRVKIRRPLAGRLFSHLRKVGGSGETVSADLVLMDGEGRELVSVEHFAMKRISSIGAERLQRSPAAPAASAPQAPAPMQVDGIRPGEGAEVLRRLLAEGFHHPQAVISPRDLNAVLERIGKTARERLTGGGSGRPQATHPRPELSTAYVAPGNDVEERLAKVWQNVLGLEQVGIHDNFFDLGGDSVIGIQVVSQANDAGLKVSPDQLFQFQTVAELAEQLGGVEAAASEEEEAWSAEPSAEEGDFADSDLDDDELAKVMDKLREIGA